MVPECPGRFGDQELKHHLLVGVREAAILGAVQRQDAKRCSGGVVAVGPDEEDRRHLNAERLDDRGGDALEEIRQVTAGIETENDGEQADRDRSGLADWRGSATEA